MFSLRSMDFHFIVEMPKFWRREPTSQMMEFMLVHFLFNVQRVQDNVILSLDMFYMDKMQTMAQFYAQGWGL